ncbi:unnamed protein product [Phaedon cochleariae]|uniref:Uncharacterized protein n=1 Tax=Phaedon cochleariae TaxID=80249 RepID=A0A9N9SFQ7_PHACE|nr:unnamed protein product [Phaedon cochleariae]
MLLDSIQRRAIRLVGDATLTHSLTSLEHRRKVGDLSLFYRYFHGKCSSEISAIIPSLAIPIRRTRQAQSAHPFVVNLERCRTALYQDSFIHRTARLWNSLPVEIRFQWSEGILGLALSGKDPEGYSTLYFHPISSFNEFNVSTKVLQNETLATNSALNYGHFKVLGSRGPKAQSGASFLHQESKVLFYSLINLNAVACWRTTLSNYSMLSQGRVFMSNETMVFPSDIKVDAKNTLWVLSNRLPRFIYGYLRSDEYNFRILKSSVSDAIRGTACDSKMKIDPHIWRNITSKLDIKNDASAKEFSHQSYCVELSKLSTKSIITPPISFDFGNQTLPHCYLEDPEGPVSPTDLISVLESTAEFNRHEEFKSFHHTRTTD